MGVSLVARVEGVGVDAFQYINDRLLRDHQASPKERWISVMRSFKQPVPPIESAPKPSPLPGATLNNPPIRSKKQRSMYCFRHSARPREIAALIEDPNAPHRPFILEKSPLNSSAINLAGKKTLETVAANPTNLETVDKMQVENQQTDHQSTTGTQPTKLPPQTNQSRPVEVNSSVAPTTDPSHYRISIISVPESFEPLLTSAICASQASLIPSAWCPRPNYVAIEGMTWGIHNSTFEFDAATASNRGPTISELSGGEIHPDWWLRLGTVTNKGAKSGSTSLPWLILEIECAASPLDFNPASFNPSSAFLESVMRAIIHPNEKLAVRPYRPTHRNLVQAGLSGDPNHSHDSPPQTVTLRNSYSMLMFAKKESLI